MKNKVNAFSITVTRYEDDIWDEEFPKFDTFIATVLDCPVSEIKDHQQYYDVSCIGIHCAFSDFPCANSVTLTYHADTDTIVSIVNRPTQYTVYEVFPYINNKNHK